RRQDPRGERRAHQAEAASRIRRRERSGFRELPPVFPQRADEGLAMPHPTLLSREWEKLTLAARLMISSGLALAVASACLLYTIVARDIERDRRQLAEKLRDEIEFIVPAIAEQAVIGDYSLIEQMLKA